MSISGTIMSKIFGASKTPATPTSASGSTSAAGNLHSLSLALSTAPKQLEQPTAYAYSDAFESEPQEQLVTSDPWKTSEFGIQSATHEPWWASVLDVQRAPVVEPELQVQQAVFESHKAFALNHSPKRYRVFLRR